MAVTPKTGAAAKPGKSGSATVVVPDPGAFYGSDDLCNEIAQRLSF